MKKLILYGNGSFARLLAWYLRRDDGRELAAATVEEAYRREPEFEGLRLIPFEKIEKVYQPDEAEIILGVGYSEMNDVRKRIFASCKEKGYRVAQYIHSSAVLSEAQLGEGNIIFEDTLVEPFVRIGSGNIIWCKISIAHNCEIGDFNTIAGMASLCGFAKVKNNCFIGNGSVVRDGITVEDYTLVGAAAYAAADTPKYSVIAANKGVVLQNKSSRDFL